ncbi:MAG: hypothetical protein EB053_06805, partial [Chlamydiae bacterium]|nr:hypothetical protein [Chlamydiota bacterium]
MMGIIKCPDIRDIEALIHLVTKVVQEVKNLYHDFFFFVKKILNIITLNLFYFLKKNMSLIDKALNFIERFSKMRFRAAVHHNYAMTLFQREFDEPLTEQVKNCLMPLFHMYLYMPAESPIRQFFFLAMQESSSPEQIRSQLKQVIDDYTTKKDAHLDPRIQKDLKVLEMMCRVIDRRNPEVGSNKIMVAAMTNFYRRYHRYSKSSRRQQGQFIDEGSFGEVFRHKSGAIDKFYLSGLNLEIALLLETIIRQEIDQDRDFLRSPMLQLDYAQRRITFRDEGISLFHLFKRDSELTEDDVLRVFCHWEDVMYALFLLNKAGYVHRDIKKNNVMFSPTTGRLGLIDFDLMMSFKELKKEMEGSGSQPVYFAWPLETYFKNNTFSQQFLRSENYFYFWSIFSTVSTAPYESRFKQLLLDISREHDKNFFVEHIPDMFINQYFEVYKDRRIRENIVFD